MWFGGDTPLAIKEYTMSVDDFLSPKVLLDSEAIATLLTRLLILEPGTIQSHPDMGVGLISRFRYSDAEEAARLKSEFQRQIAEYLPDYAGVPIEVEAKDMTFYISAQINGILYGISYQVDTSTVNSKYTKLSNL